MKKIISPILYTLCVIFAFFSGLFAVMVIGSISGWNTPETPTLVFTIFIWGVVVSGLASYFLLRFEGMKIPTIKDHLRHSSFLYVMFVSFLVVSIQLSLFYKYGSPGGIIVFLALVVLFTGILVNALTLFVVAKKSKNIQV